MHKSWHSGTGVICLMYRCMCPVHVHVHVHTYIKSCMHTYNIHVHADVQSGQYNADSVLHKVFIQCTCTCTYNVLVHLKRGFRGRYIFSPYTVHVHVRTLYYCSHYTCILDVASLHHHSFSRITCSTYM